MWAFIGAVLLPILIYREQKNQIIKIKEYSIKVPRKHFLLDIFPKIFLWLTCTYSILNDYSIRILYMLTGVMLLEIISSFYKIKEIKRIIDYTFKDEVLRDELKKDSEFKSYWVIGVYTLILILLGITLLNK